MISQCESMDIIIVLHKAISCRANISGLSRISDPGVDGVNKALTFTKHDRIKLPTKFKCSKWAGNLLVSNRRLYTSQIAYRHMDCTAHLPVCLWNCMFRIYSFPNPNVCPLTNLKNCLIEICSQRSNFENYETFQCHNLDQSVSEGANKCCIYMWSCQ